MKRLRHGWAVLMAGLLLVGMLIQVRGSVVASSVSVTGLGAADATVTDSSGKDVTHNTDLDRYSTYSVKYHFTIANGTPVNSGDTTTFTLPTNVLVVNNQTCNVYDQNGTVAGTATIAAGSRTGTITFNDDLHGKFNRHGTLTVGVMGTVDHNVPTKPSQGGGTVSPVDTAPTINKVGWYDQNNKNIIHWDVVINMDNVQLIGPVVTDNLGPGMEIIPSSVVVQQGHYRNGQFINDGSIPPADVMIGDKQLTVNVPGTYRAINIAYETRITDPDQASYTNTAQVTAANMSQTGVNSATLPGNLHGNVVFDEGTLTVTKVDAQTGKKLAGAGFTLYAPGGGVVATGKTGADGTVSFDKLNAGHYYLEETTAPAGYTLNTQPTEVVIPDNKQAVNLTVRDTKQAAASSSSSVSSSSNASSSVRTPVSSSASVKQPVMSMTPAAEQGGSSRAGSSRSVRTEGNSRVTSRSARTVEERINGRTEVAKRTTSVKNAHRAGLPDTGDQAMPVLIVIGMVVLAGAGMIAIRRR